MQTKKRLFKTKKAKIWLIASLTLIATLVAICFIYLGSYYHADEAFINEYPKSSEELTIDGNLVFKPENAKLGLIFYPGGKVDERAYIPLMREISSHGVLCVVVKMPFRLAVLKPNAANGIKESFPEIEGWYIGGHSLGGAMAAKYFEKNADDLRGIFLLASYSTADLSASDARALSVIGSLDGVMNREKYEKYLKNMPKDFEELVIEGGNHAYFGAYGEQKGDGNAKITRAEQIKKCAEAFITWINEQ